MAIIFSLVHNPGTTDARVMKEARALVSRGHKVRIYGRLENGYSEKEIVDGIEIVRFPCFAHEGLDLNSFNDISETLGKDFYRLFKPHLTKYIAGRCQLKAVEEMRQRIKDQLSPVAENLVLLKKERNSLAGRLKKIKKTRKDGIARFFAYKMRMLKPGNRAVVDRLNAVNSSLEKNLKIRDAAREEIKNIDVANSRKQILDGIRESAFYCRLALYAANFQKLSQDIKPDVIHCHDLYPLLGAVLESKRIGSKVIYDAHEYEIERVPPLPQDKKGFVDAVERRLLEGVDHLITVCDSLADLYDERYGKRHPKVVMNAPEIRKDSLYKEVDIRSLAGLDEDIPVIVYVGGVGQEGRGMDKAVRALAKIPSAHLVVIGPRHERNDKWLLRNAEEAGVLHRISLVPGVPSDLVVSAVRTASVGICLIQDISLSYRYSMPNKLLEMASAQVPIVVSNLPDMSKFVEELGIGVVVNQEDPASIAEGINEIISNSEKYKISSDKMQILKDKYSWESQAENLFDAYREIGEESHSPTTPDSATKISQLMS